MLSLSQVFNVWGSASGNPWYGYQQYHFNHKDCKCYKLALNHCKFLIENELYNTAFFYTGKIFFSVFSLLTLQIKMFEQGGLLSKTWKWRMKKAPFARCWCSWESACIKLLQFSRAFSGRGWATWNSWTRWSFRTEGERNGLFAKLCHIHNTI